MTSVVDASVWTSRFLPQDVYHQASVRWLRGELSAGEPLVGPIHLLAEVGGAVARRTGDPRAGRRAVAVLLRLPSVRLVPLDQSLGETSARLAADLRLCGADAEYVALASVLGVPMVTWDGEQIGRAAGVIAAHTP